jgi:CheY-like chemotaxis protein
MKIRNRAFVAISQRAAEETFLVLIADDNEDARDMYAAALRYYGLRVETTGDGREAIDKARLLCPDAIVLDLAMPVLEGDQAAMVLKADLRTRHIPVIALTADTFLGRAKAREAGFDAFCTKPCLPIELAEIVAALIQAAKPPSAVHLRSQETA